MDNRIANASRPDLVMTESMARPTPTPARVSFSQVLAAGMNGIVQGAELVASKLPGSPMTAAAVRSGMATMSSPIAALGGLSVNAQAEGPVGVGSLGSIGAPGAGIAATADPSGSIDSTLQQSAQMNLYYLQIQQEVDAQNRTFTTLSNVLKTEHDSAKSAISNIHS
ncbi:MAG: hypothetical protein M3O46_01525 [Myxococcota bacterium]|nr:hypothetical protein [Myxococcota bacterium]